MIDILQVCLTVASTVGIAEPSFAFVPYCATWPTLNTIFPGGTLSSPTLSGFSQPVPLNFFHISGIHPATSSTFLHSSYSGITSQL